MCHALQKLNIRLVVLLLCLLLILTAVPVVRAEGESGTCGDNLSWTLSAGTLTISGSGDMWDFPESTMAPWYLYRDEILRLELPQGLTSVGNLAFYDCEQLLAAVIPSSVSRIGDYAFAGCSDLQLLDLGSVKTIGEAAFSDCVSLPAVFLPEGLQRIGTMAFYRCEAIATVMIPESVTSIGNTAFGYCKQLISANIQADIRTIPEYLFYKCENLSEITLPDSVAEINNFAFRGCNQLTTVHYGGTSQSVEQIYESLKDEVPNFETSGTVVETPSTGTTIVTTTQSGEDGTTIQKDTIVAQGDSVSATSKVENADGQVSGDFSVTVQDKDGWEDAQFFLDVAINNLKNEANSNGMKIESIEVDVFVKDSEEINQEFVNSMVEHGALVTITTSNGSKWKIHGNDQKLGNSLNDVNLSYTLSAGSAELNAELGVETSFVIQFHNSAEVNAEVMVYLGTEWAQQQATLVQYEDPDYKQLQTVVVDLQGYAHFYLASVDENIEYAIAMNFSAEEAPIIPTELYASYSVENDYDGVEYVVTGRKSSWGMNLGQVMSILAVVMVSVIAVVGIAMYSWNKKRLKNGYVPNWDDEDE